MAAAKDRWYGKDPKSGQENLEWVFVRGVYISEGNKPISLIVPPVGNG